MSAGAGDPRIRVDVVLDFEEMAKKDSPVTT
jgi:hypothetical protein